MPSEPLDLDAVDQMVTAGHWVSGITVRRLINALRASRAEVERLKEPELCSVCVGTGRPVSGKPCICNGVGTQLAELQGFRELVFERQAEVERLRDVLERIAGGPVQSALCTSPTRKMEHLSTMCPHCRARAALKSEQFRGGAVAAQPGERRCPVVGCDLPEPHDHASGGPDKAAQPGEAEHE